MVFHVKRSLKRFILADDVILFLLGKGAFANIAFIVQPLPHQLHPVGIKGMLIDCSNSVRRVIIIAPEAGRIRAVNQLPDGVKALLPAEGNVV